MKKTIKITFEDLPKSDQMNVTITITKNISIKKIIAVLDVAQQAVSKSKLIKKL